jgi:hypothetical protein
MTDYIRKYRIPLIFGMAGAIAGFLYWRFVGCLSGTCMLRSVWYWTTLWGAAVGYLIGDTIRDFIVKRKNKKDERTVSSDN